MKQLPVRRIRKARDRIAGQLISSEFTGQLYYVQGGVGAYDRMGKQLLLAKLGRLGAQKQCQLGMGDSKVVIRQHLGRNVNLCAGGSQFTRWKSPRWPLPHHYQQCGCKASRPP